MNNIILSIGLFLFSSVALAYKDPTHGKPFWPWLWEEQFQPTLKKSIDGHGTSILASGIAATFTTRVYDKKLYQHNRVHGDFMMGHNDSQQLGKLGNGLMGIGIAATQLFIDTENGVRHFRALILTTTSHVSLAAIARRKRPDNRTDYLPFPSSFPSGHTSSAFATAGSLAYAYGWEAGIPAYTVATAIGISRIKEDRHWASDVVAGVFLGTFWARASYRADEERNPDTVLYVPTPIYDGFMLTALKEW